MSLVIGNVKLDNNLIFAPIAGFSDVGYRSICAKLGAGLTVTELVSAKAIVYHNKGTDELLATTDAEKVKCVQIFGNDPKFIYRAAQDERLKKFDIIDINMGCPVKKVFNNGEGSALMNNPTLIEEIVKAAIEGSSKPVTVKMRAGIETGKPLALECSIAAEKAGASAITIHARYRDQMYSGEADHSITKLVKESVGIPVIANGDMIDAKSLNMVKTQTNADGFMIARGALGRPWIFSELLKKDIEYNRKEIIYNHIDTLRKYYNDLTVANSMKLHLCYYARGERFAKQVRVAVGEAKSLDDIINLIEIYFKV